MCALQRRTHGVDIANALEGVIHASEALLRRLFLPQRTQSPYGQATTTAPGTHNDDVLYLLVWVVGGVDELHRVAAERLGARRLVGVGVNGDDLTRASLAQAHDHCQTHAAQACSAVGACCNSSMVRYRDAV
jgi:hypothetical protein